MVKVKEFCCGCSLRSGTYIAAWGLLVWSFYIFIVAVYYFMFILRLATKTSSWTRCLFAYDVTRTTIGMTVSLIAIWALQKVGNMYFHPLVVACNVKSYNYHGQGANNKSKFLSGLLWYLYYSITFTILDEMLLIFAFDVEVSYLWTLNLMGHSYVRSGRSEDIALIFLIYLFGIGVASYFALIVKSYRDYSFRNEAHNVQFVGPDATTVGYITA